MAKKTKKRPVRKGRRISAVCVIDERTPVNLTWFKPSKASVKRAAKLRALVLNPASVWS